jgi:hypothetical protein
MSRPADYIYRIDICCIYTEGHPQTYIHRIYTPPLAPYYFDTPKVLTLRGILLYLPKAQTGLSINRNLNRDGENSERTLCLPRDSLSTQCRARDSGAVANDGDKCGTFKGDWIRRDVVTSLSPSVRGQAPSVQRIGARVPLRGCDGHRRSSAISSVASPVVVILSLVVASHQSPSDVLFSPLVACRRCPCSLSEVVANTASFFAVFEIHGWWLRPPVPRHHSLDDSRLNSVPNPCCSHHKMMSPSIGSRRR